MAPQNNAGNCFDAPVNNTEVYISTIKILLAQVKLESKKTFFNRRLTKAVMQNNEPGLMALMKDLGDYISKMAGRSKRDAAKKEPVYQTVPTFDQAVIDLVHQCCADLEQFPDLNEYYAEVEKTLFEEIGKSNFGNGGRRRRGGGSDSEDEDDYRETSSIQTIVKRDMVVASASCQSGKSSFMICAGIKGMVSGKVPVFVTRNVTGDGNQLESGCQKYADIVEAYLTKHGVTERKFKIEVLRAKDLDKPSHRQQAVDAFNGKSLKMIICLGNKTQLDKVMSLAKETSGKINLFIDEVDYVDYGEDSDTAETLSALKEYAYQTIGITATPLSVMFNEEDLKSTNQLRLKPPTDYRGFIDIIYKPFEHEVSALNKKATYSEIVKSDPNLEKFLKQFSKSRPDNAYALGEFIPNICLIKNSRFIENQESLFLGIVKKYKELAVMVYNGSGVRMHVPGGKEDKTYKKINISDALQYLRDNGGVKKFPRIIIISGDLAGRCISYVPKDYSWHLTDMYYVPAASTSVPELIQSAGRLCGRNRGKGHLHLHASLKVVDALFKGFKFTEEIIDRSIASPMICNGQEKSFSESLMNTPMNKDKAPPASRKLVNKADVRKGDFNLVKGKDGGENLEKYKYKTTETPEEEEVEENKEETRGETEGRYFLILQDEITAGLAKKILEAAIDIIVDTRNTGKNVQRAWINKELLEMGKTEFKHTDQLNGSWQNVMNKKKSCSIEEKGLVFWKLGNQIWLRLNM